MMTFVSTLAIVFLLLGIFLTEGTVNFPAISSTLFVKPKSCGIFSLKIILPQVVLVKPV